jgi:hypothetical protein
MQQLWHTGRYTAAFLSVTEDSSWSSPYFGWMESISVFHQLTQAYSLLGGQWREAPHIMSHYSFSVRMLYGFSIFLPHRFNLVWTELLKFWYCQSQSHITTDSQSASQSWRQALSGAQDHILHVGILQSVVKSPFPCGYLLFTVLCVILVYMYVEYIQGLCQSRPGTADHALTHVAHVTMAA